jgi:acyl-CoA reductase-like NAD-dependent aldehyde dehydrogenase
VRVWEGETQDQRAAPFNISRHQSPSGVVVVVGPWVAPSLSPLAFLFQGRSFPACTCWFLR